MSNRTTDKHVRIVEVGARDGLQAEPTIVPTETKLRFIRMLADAGLREIEAASFVSPKAIPQLADAEAVFTGLPKDDGIRYPVLVPNARGLQRAEAAGATAIAVFAATDDTYSLKNIGMSVEQSLATFEPILRAGRHRGWWTRAYVSTAFGSPAGRVDPATPVAIALRLADMGAQEIAVSDTLGVGVPSQVTELVAGLVSGGLPVDRIAFHFHDTRGTALANVSAALQAGVRSFDSSAGGTGGSPFAPGAAGNLATEDLAYFLQALGYETGVDLARVLAAARFMADTLGRPLRTKVGLAGGWDPETGRAVGLA